MADYGYQYVNIDDCWMKKAGPSARTAKGEMTGNEHFPDMPALTAYIHDKGLKAGIYTSPGPATFCGCKRRRLAARGAGCGHFRPVGF